MNASTSQIKNETRNLRFQNTSCYISLLKTKLCLPFKKMFLFILHVNKNPHIQIVLSCCTKLNCNSIVYIYIKIVLINNINIIFKDRKL